MMNKALLLPLVAGAGALLLLAGKSKAASPGTSNPGPFPPPAPPLGTSPEADQKAARAVQLSLHLNNLVKQFGSAAKAKGHEDRNMVAGFQTQESLKPDGLYGPNSRAALARYVSNAPPVFYFPKGSSGAAPSATNNDVRFQSGSAFNLVAGNTYGFQGTVTGDADAAAAALSDATGSDVEVVGQTIFFSAKQTNNQSISPNMVAGGVPITLSSVSPA